MYGIFGSYQVPGVRAKNVELPAIRQRPALEVYMSHVRRVFLTTYTARLNLAL